MFPRPVTTLQSFDTPAADCMKEEWNGGLDLGHCDSEYLGDFLTAYFIVQALECAFGD